MAVKLLSKSFMGNKLPGPCEYTPNHGVVERPISKRITFGSKQDFSFVGEKTPGPGSYNDTRSAMRTANAIRIGRSSRNDSLDPYRTDGPGPAAYSPAKRSVSSCGGRFSKAQRGTSWRSFAPGPGTYPVRQVVGREGTKPSLVARRPDTSPRYGLNSPGPGAYQVNSNRRSTTGFTIGKQKRGNESFSGNKVPGPLAYSPNDQQMRRTSPMWRYTSRLTSGRIGKGKRPPLLVVNVGPGPCSYNLPSKLGDGPKCKLHGKRSEEKPEAIPGPGAYDPNMKNVLERFPAIALSTGPRVEKDFSTRKDVPGPGKYALNTTLDGPKFGFGVSGKVAPKSDPAIPGPGAYKVPCTFANVANYLIPSRPDAFKYV